jgi:parallel beta-helix repeat protein
MKLFKLLLVCFLIFSILYINVTTFQKIGLVPNYESGYVNSSVYGIIFFLKAMILLLVLFIIHYRKIIFIANRFYKKLNNKKIKLILFFILLLIFFLIYLQLIIVIKVTFIELEDRQYSVEKSKFSLEFIKVLILEAYDTIQLYPRIFYSNLIYNNMDISKNDLNIYNIHIKQDYLDKLNSNLPFSGRDYYNAEILLENETIPIKLRYRGLEIDNWFFPKKSLKLKIKDKRLLNSQNKINLLTTQDPSFMELKLNYDLAESFNIMTTTAEYASVLLNGKYLGVYLDVVQLDETFLRNSNFLPGDIYGIDLSIENIKNNITGVSQEDVKFWEIEATYDRDLNRSRKNIAFFLNGQNLSDSEFKNFFDKHLGNEYLKFNSFLTIFSNMHTGDNENLRIYYNPATEKFIHILWDPIIGSVNQPIGSVSLTPMKKVYEYPELVQTKNEYLYEYITNISPIIKNQIKEYHNKIQYEVYHDKYKIQKYAPWFITNKEWESSINKLYNKIYHRITFINKSLNNNTVVIYNLNKTIYFDVSGTSGSTIMFKSNSCDSFAIQNVLTSFCGNATISTLLPGRKIKDNSKLMNYLIFEPSVLRYNITWEGKIPNEFTVINSITKTEKKIKVIPINSESNLLYLNNTISKHPWNKKELDNEIIFIDDEVVLLNEDLHILSNQKLIIQPGAKILIKENVSINIEGGIIAKGTEENPIIITAYGNSWGAITISGDKSYGVFDHIFLSKGSGDSFRKTKYTGMLSAYGAEYLILNNSLIKENYYFDDAINSKETYTLIDSSIFKNIQFDAIDFDKSKGEIIGNKFYNIGNDAIDLSLSNINVSHNYIENVGDKGISVGEKSNPNIISNTIKNASIGIAVKDLSSPILIDNLFINNLIALASYKKIWRYEFGGSPFVGKNYFENNLLNISLDHENLSIGKSHIIFLNNSVIT